MTEEEVQQKIRQSKAYSEEWIYWMNRLNDIYFPIGYVFVCSCGKYKSEKMPDGTWKKLEREQGSVVPVANE